MNHTAFLLVLLCSLSLSCKNKVEVSKSEATSPNATLLDRLGNDDLSRKDYETVIAELRKNGVSHRAIVQRLYFAIAKCLMQNRELPADRILFFAQKAEPNNLKHVYNRVLINLSNKRVKVGIRLLTQFDKMAKGRKTKKDLEMISNMSEFRRSIAQKGEKTLNYILDMGPVEKKLFDKWRKLLSERREEQRARECDLIRAKLQYVRILQKRQTNLKTILHLKNRGLDYESHWKQELALKASMKEKKEYISRNGGGIPKVVSPETVLTLITEKKKACRTRSDCMKSIQCKHLGLCSIQNGDCIALTRKDCEESSVCKQKGQCSPVDGACKTEKERKKPTEQVRSSIQPSIDNAPKPRMDNEAVQKRNAPRKIVDRGTKPSGSKPYVVVARSVDVERRNSRRVADRYAEKLLGKGFPNAIVLDGRKYSGFRCCYWVVSIGTFASRSDASDLSLKAKKAGLKGIYPRRAIKENN